MYFIKLYPLKEKLRERSVSDREALPYLIIFGVLTTLAVYLPAQENYNNWDAFNVVLSLILTIGGTLYAYFENGGNDGFDFIQKYVVLGWVVFVRFFLGSFPIFLLLIYIGISSGLHSSEATSPYGVLIAFLWEVIFYQRLGRHIKDTTKTS